MSHLISRRRFLGQVNCAAISALPILNTLLNLKLAGNVAAAPAAGGYRALVCLFLSGGADTFNVLVPQGPSEYQEYATVRGGIALPRASLLPINPTVSPGLQLGLHPGLTGIQSLFESGKAAFVTNVGTLIERVTKSEYDDDLKRLPLNLYSHSDQIEQWQTSTPDLRSPRGWAGRAADILRASNSNNAVSMNISLTGSNIWQSGENTLEYTVSTDGAIGLEGYNPADTSPWGTVPIRTRAIDSQLGFQYQHLLSQAFAARKVDAMDAYTLFNAATDVTLPAAVTFPDTYLGAQFKMIAKSIAGHGALGHNRQTFFVERGGWDHHDGVIAAQAEMLPEVDAAIKAFSDCLKALGMENDVTLFTASDFARTLTTDNDGADHAWGGNQMVIGGAVNGKRIYGTYPNLYVDNPLDVGRGRLIPQVSVDEFFAELALWFGVSPTDLEMVLPNIRNFYIPTAGSRPLGFMA
ncbi:MAG: hypothetical protein QOE70_4881 [Chthoniobacter sp.]|jgi:uncharacterized protein (DUF1501 family)|nr:hypothetical protein [Chthoniobacter sp.]